MKRAKMLLVVILSLLLVGCWDQQEITALASISGLGFDVGSYAHTMRISVLTSPPQPFGGGGGGGGSRLRVITVEAASFTEGITLLQGHLRREPFFLHLGFVVFGEELAKSGLDGVLSALQGRTTIRGSVPVFVAQQTAEETLKARSGGGHAPGEDVADLRDNFATAPLGRHVSIHEVRNTLLALGSELTLPILELAPLRLQAGDETPATGVGVAGEQLHEVFVRRMAVFSRDRWVADLDQYLVQTFVMLKGDTRVGSATIVDPADPTSHMGLTIVNFSARFDIKSGEETVEITISPRVRAVVREVTGTYSLRDRGFAPIAMNLEQDIDHQVQQVVAFLQENQADALGFGHMLRRSNPTAWSKLENRWSEVFPAMTVRVNTEVKIDGTAMVARFFEIKRED